MRAEHERFMRQQRDESHDGLSTDSITSPPNTSPFSTFKKYIDSNLGVLTESLLNLPSNLVELREKMQRERELRKEEELDISRRWTGSSDSPDHIQLQVQRSTEQEKADAHYLTAMLIAEATAKNKDVHIELIEALFRDPQTRFGDLDRFASPMLSMGGACYYKPESGGNLPSTRSWAWTSATTPRWLSVDWFKRSPYSPIRLEAHPDLEAEGCKWRAAFEDLMNVTLGKPMVTEERWGFKPSLTEDRRHFQPMGDNRHSTFTGPGLSWLISLQCRGILPPLLPRYYNDIRRQWDKPQQLVSDHLEDAGNDIPWSLDATPTFCSPLFNDVSDLRSEIAIKSTWESPPSTAFYQQPETELDMYSYPYNFRPAVDEGATEGATEDVATERAEEALWGMIEEMSWAMKGSQEEMDSEAAWDRMFASSAKYSHLSDLIDERLSRRESSEMGESSDKTDEYYLSQLKSPVEKAYFRTFWTLMEGLNMSEKWAERFRREFPLGIAQDENTKQKLEELFRAFMDDAHSLNSARPTSASQTRNADVKERSQPAPQQLVTDSKILSALTTTQTTRLPDGTVTTKVVLKQRFADGREETQESVHTSHEAVAPAVEERKSKQQRGWFWS